MIDVAAVEARLRDAYRRRALVAPPSSEDPAFDLTAAYAVEAEYVRGRRADGHRTAGLKVGFANKAMWRVLKLDTLVYGHMYDDTVHDAASGRARLAMAPLVSPKIEPEIVFKLKRPIPSGLTDAAAVLDAVEWLALGFEIIDCVYPDWKYQPQDFVAAFGLHAALFVGRPLIVDAANIPALAGALPTFKVKLLRNGDVAAEGSGKNSLRSPALCLAELANAVGARAGAAALAAGDLVSSGTLTESMPIAAGETWRAEVDGLALDPIEIATA